MKTFIQVCIFVIFLTPELAGALTLVENGEPRAIIVTADAPTAVATYAAEELARHIKEASEARLPIVRESQIPHEGEKRVYVGSTRTASKSGISTAELGADAFVLRGGENHLFVLGREDEATQPLVTPFKTGGKNMVKQIRNGSCFEKTANAAPRQMNRRAT